MKPTDVTDDQYCRYLEVAVDIDFNIEDYEECVKRQIAAAVNAVFGDPTPITAGRLRSFGYTNPTGSSLWYSPTDDFDLKEPRIVAKCWSYDEAVAPDDYPIIDKLEIHFDQAMNQTGRYVESSVQTIGELRALHWGLGQPLQENGK